MRRIIAIALFVMLLLSMTASAEMVYIVRNVPYDDTGMAFEDGMLRLLFYFDAQYVGVLPDDASKIMESNWNDMLTTEGSDAAVVSMLRIDVDMR